MYLIDIIKYVEVFFFNFSVENRNINKYKNSYPLAEFRWNLFDKSGLGITKQCLEFFGMHRILLYYKNYRYYLLNKMQIIIL